MEIYVCLVGNDIFTERMGTMCMKVTSLKLMNWSRYSSNNILLVLCLLSVDITNATLNRLLCSQKENGLCLLVLFYVQ